MRSLARFCVALAAVALLSGCFAVLGPDDPITFGHALWCQESPPSGYCIVGEPF